MPISSSANALAGAVAASQPADAGMRTGIITNINDDSVDINISGSVMTLPFLSSYQPLEGDVANVVRMDDSWLVLGTSGFHANVPFGIQDMVMMDVGTVGPTSGTTELEIPNLALSFNAVAGRLYLIFIQIYLTCSVATDRYFVQAHAGSLGGTTIGNCLDTLNNTLGGSRAYSWPYTPSSSGSSSIHFGIARSSGTGTFTANGSPGADIPRTWASVADVSYDLLRIV